MNKLKDLLPDIEELVKFKDEDAFKKYKAKHKMRPTTQVQIGDKKTTAGEEEPKKDDSSSSSKSSSKAKQAGIGAGEKNLKGPQTDADAIGGSAKKEQAVLKKLRAIGPDDNVDLCTVTVPGTNMFCAGNKGIPRAEMPQLKSKVVPNGKADKLVKAGKLTKDSEGEVNTEGLFKSMLEKEGISMSDPTPALTPKASAPLP